MLFVSFPAVVIRKNSGCLRLSPLPFVITSNSFLFGWVWSSSKITPLVLKPCLLATSAESTLYLLFVGLYIIVLVDFWIVTRFLRAGQSMTISTDKPEPAPLVYAIVKE